MSSAGWTGGPLVQAYALSPAEIERRSLALIAAAAQALRLPAWDEAERAVALRMAYAAGDPDILGAVAISPGAVRSGVLALRGGAPIVCDVRMAAAGVFAAARQALGTALHVAIDHPEVAAAARESGLPRAVHAMAYMRGHLAGAVVLIGNAPTALLALLDLVDGGAGRPALVVAAPPGFVAAAEAKEELCGRDLPQIVVRGARGGSAVAAAAVNALLRLAGPEVRHG